MDDAIIQRNQLILGAVVGLVSTFFSGGLWFVFALITIGLLILSHFAHKRVAEVQLESGPIPPKLNDNLPDAEEAFLVSKFNDLRYELNKHEDIVRQPLNG